MEDYYQEITTSCSPVSPKWGEGEIPTVWDKTSEIRISIMQKCFKKLLKGKRAISEAVEAQKLFPHTAAITKICLSSNNLGAMFSERREMVPIRVGNEHFKPSLLPATHLPTQTELLRVEGQGQADLIGCLLATTLLYNVLKWLVAYGGNRNEGCCLFLLSIKLHDFSLERSTAFDISQVGF